VAVVVDNAVLGCRGPRIMGCWGVAGRGEGEPDWEVAGEDMRKGLHRAIGQLERRWRDWSVQQTPAK